MPSSSEEPSREEFEHLVWLSGADPTQHGVMVGAGKSVPLFPKIEGKKGYPSALRGAARELHDWLRDDEGIRELIAAGGRVVLAKQDRGQLPRLSRPANPNALLALEHLLHSLAFIASNPRTKRGWNDYVAVPMNRHAFVDGRKYGHISGTAFIGVVLALTQFAPDGGRPWLEYVPPFRNSETGHRMNTRIKPSRDFCDWMIQRGLIFPWHPKPRTRRSKALTSLLWVSTDPDPDDESNDKGEYALDRLPMGDEAILPGLNRRLVKQKLTLRHEDYAEYLSFYDLGKGQPRLPAVFNRRVYRKFAYRDGQGGRLYGPSVQSLPSELRKKRLRIDGQPVAERDFENMQLVLLYAMAGEPVPEGGDLYQIEGCSRDDMKAVLTRSVGVGSRKQALGALRKYLKDEGRLRKGRAERLYDAFWNRHRAICPHGTDTEPAWSRLQRADSDVALRVLKYLLDEGIVAIPIHDSFVVQAHHADRLEATMKRAFHDFWPGVPIRIKPATT